MHLDRLVCVLERRLSQRLGHHAVFAPKPEPEGVGNGVHIHISLWDAAGRPATYEAGETMDLSKAAQHFCAGILHHMPAICAVTAPSPVSYLRLVPNRWAPTAIDLLRQDRGMRALVGLAVCLLATPAMAMHHGYHHHHGYIHNELPVRNAANFGFGSPYGSYNFYPGYNFSPGYDYAPGEDYRNDFDRRNTFS